MLKLLPHYNLSYITFENVSKGVKITDIIHLSLPRMCMASFSLLKLLSSEA